MSKYLITYHNGGMPSDPAAMEQVKAAFGKWLQEAGKLVIDAGSPVRMVTQVSQGNPSPAAEIGGYTIIESVSKEEAMNVLKSHPFISRGGTLQVNEIMA